MRNPVNTKPHYHKEPSQEFNDSMAILRLCGFVRRHEYLEAMWRMSEKYPGRGWAGEAVKLEKFYEDHDKPVENCMDFGSVVK